MSRREPDLEDIIMYGILGTLGLGFVGIVVFFAVQAPVSLAIALGAILGFIGMVFVVGWCIANFNNFREMFKANKIHDAPTAPLRTLYYSVPVLDGLAYFEYKYHISTIHFMNYVYHDTIPDTMNNLDYLEWLSLANELPSITLDKTNASR